MLPSSLVQKLLEKLPNQENILKKLEEIQKQSKILNNSSVISPTSNNSPDEEIEIPVKDKDESKSKKKEKKVFHKN